MREFILTLVAAAVLTATGACSADPEQGPAIDDRERRMGAEQHEVLLAQFGGAYQGPEAAYFKNLGEKIATAADLGGECTFTLVNTDVVNAFAVPGCYIYLTRGLMALVNSEAELVSVIGHELGHIVADHSEQQQRRSMLRQLGVLAVALTTESELLTRLAGGAAELFTFRYSRRHEYEADELAVKYLVASGYDPYEAGDMLDALGRHERFQEGRSGEDHHAIPEWSRTHPLTGNRVERVSAAAAAAGIRPGELATKEPAFLDQVDGLLFGDDPGQGFVMGRRFAHPAMRLAFEVPRGFKMTNTPRAVLIEGPDGVRGEFSSGGAGRELEQYIQHIAEEAFGGAADARAASRTVVNGLPAIVLPLSLPTAQGPAEALIAAYEGPGGSAYHFLLIAPPGQRMPNSVSQLIGSLMPISAAQAAQLRPRIIRVVTAAEGDSLQSLAARMASERPLEHFLLLNDQVRAEPVRPGERIKLISVAS